MNNIVCGPPGSGKTTFVKNHQQSGDLIIDLDAIFQAISGLPWYEKPNNLLKTALAVQDFLIAQVQADRVNCFNTWLIVGGAKLLTRAKLARRLEAKVYVMEVNPVECLRRIGLDPRRKDKALLWKPIIHKWWEEYEPSDVDIKVKDGAG